MEEPADHPDWALVVALGGPVKVAALLGYRKEGGVQRVQNWKARGIPPAVKVAHPHLFLKELQEQRSGGGRRVRAQPAASKVE